MYFILKLYRFFLNKNNKVVKNLYYIIDLIHIFMVKIENFTI